nr:hypothetical protein [bacterium]
MSTGQLITAEWQIERNGLLMGDGTVYDLVNIEGLAGAPAAVPSDRALAQRNGSIAGEDYLSARSIILTFEIVDDNTSTMTAKLDAL